MNKPVVATTSLAGCFGCHMSILDIDEKILDLIELVEFNKSPIDDIKTFTKQCNIGLIEGGCANSENVHILKEFRKHCKILISVGECAIMGGLPALRNGIPIRECLREAFLTGLSVLMLLGTAYAAAGLTTFVFGITVIINSSYGIFQMFISYSTPTWFRWVNFFIELIALVLGLMMVLDVYLGVVIVIIWVAFILIFNGIKRIVRALGHRIVQIQEEVLVEVEPISVEPHEIEGSVRWVETNGQKYLEVIAKDHYDLGYLQGTKVADQVKHLTGIIQSITLKYIPKNKMSYKDYIKQSKYYEAYIPDFLRREMLGMADAINGLTYDDILLQNTFIDIMYGRLLPMDSLSIILRSFDLGCTGFGAIMPDYILRGQNFDFANMFYNAQWFSLLRVEGKPDIFSLRLGSMLGFPAGHNSYGMSINVNIIKSFVQSPYTIPASVKTRLMFERSRIAEDAFKLLLETPLPASCNLLLSDKEKIIAVENVPNRHAKTDVIDKVARSNTFITDYMEKLLIRKKYSKKRQRRAEFLLNEAYQKGQMNDDDLIQILSDEPIICRLHKLQPMTIAFITNKYFGIGNPKYDSHGLVPIPNIGKK